MKYSAIPLLGLMAFASQVSAEDHFIGLEASLPNMKYQDKYTSGNDSENTKENLNKDAFGIHLKAGFERDFYRIYGLYAYDKAGAKNKKDGIKYDVNVKSISLGIDWIYRPQKNIGLFLGPHIGAGQAHFKLTDTDNKEASLKKESSLGFIYGGQAGALVDCGKYLQFEAGYRASWMQLDATKKYDDGRKLTMKATHMQGPYAAATFKF